MELYHQTADELVEVICEHRLSQALLDGLPLPLIASLISLPLCDTSVMLPTSLVTRS